MPEKELRTYWEEVMEKMGVSKALHLPHFHTLTRLYGHSRRAYHNLNHLAELFALWRRDYHKLQKPEELALAIFYHDAIYKPWSSKNEEASADLAARQLRQGGIKRESIEMIYSYILCTRDHRPTLEDEDLIWLLDADLSILGSSKESYQEYARQIRQEFRLYPDFLYRPGRKKVLMGLLERKNIYRSPHFYEDLEERARQNIKWELDR